MPHQQKAHDATWAAWASGISDTLVTMATGTGKTAVAAMVATTGVSLGKRTLFLADRELLVTNAAKELRAHGIDTSIEMGTANARRHRDLLGDSDAIVATVQTLHADRRGNWPRNHFDIIVTDECHRAADPTHRAIYEYFQNYTHLGLTATPDGRSGRIGEIFKSHAFDYSIRNAQLDGLIPRFELEECQIPIDLKNIRVTGGDYNSGDLAEALSPHIHYIAEAIKQRIGDRSTVIFTPDTGSALALKQALGSPGPGGSRRISTEYVAGDSGRFRVDPKTRRLALERFHSGESQCITSCEYLVEGWDCPRASCVVIAKPTRHRYRFVQMVGRVTRRYPGKDHCLIVDFDWKNSGESRDMVTPVGIFALEDPAFLELDAVSKRSVIDNAKSIVRQGQKDPSAAYDEAMKRHTSQAYLPMFLLPGTEVNFTIRSYDPMLVSKTLGLKLSRADKDLKSGRYEPARSWQISKLAKAGVTDADKLTFFGASKILRALESRSKNGMASLSQMSKLIERGVGEIHARNMSVTMADRFIETDNGLL